MSPRESQYNLHKKEKGKESEGAGGTSRGCGCAHRAGAVATTLVIPLTAGDSGAPHGVPEGRTFGRLRQTRHCRPRDALQSRSFSRALSTRQAKREPGAVAFSGVTRTRLPGVSLPLPRRETLLGSRLLVVYPKLNKQNLVTALPPLSLCALF